MLAYPFEDSRSFSCLNTEPNKNSSHFQHFNPVLWIRITLMRIRIRLINLLIGSYSINFILSSAN
jgi:hypothetical protein